MSDEITKAEGMEGQTATDEKEQKRDRADELIGHMREFDFSLGDHLNETGDGIGTGKVRTNLPALDALLGGGLTPGLHAITGGPSSYKTTLLLQTAYLAALDGHVTEYITDEVGKRECWARLTSRTMQIVRIKAGNQEPAPAWSQLEEHRRMAELGRDVSALEELHDAMRAMYGMAEGDWLDIREMGKVLPSRTTPESELDIEEDVECNDRYTPGYVREKMEDGKLRASGRTTLFIIDPVNALRLYEHDWNKIDGWYYRDANGDDPRARMEEIVTLLDNWGRKTNTVVVGVFHGSRTGGGSGAHHPSMADFKETSAIEYRAVSAIELVRAADMKWPGHPKPPKHERPGEAVGLFVLKSRHGQRTPDNEPVWLLCDGAHNLVAPMQ